MRRCLKAGISHCEAKMVKSYEQAARIQKKRQLANKPGVAAAVKRFMKRTGAKMDCGLAPLYRG